MEEKGSEKSEAMAYRHDVILEDYERVTLEEMRDHHPKAYMRERAAALLKIEAGSSIHAVAQTGLLKKREWETVASWVRHYEQEGLGGLYLRSGRGRKPSFPP
jgi:HKD family nuclease